MRVTKGNSKSFFVSSVQKGRRFFPGASNFLSQKGLNPSSPSYFLRAHHSKGIARKPLPRGTYPTKIAEEGVYWDLINRDLLEVTGASSLAHLQGELKRKGGKLEIVGKREHEGSLPIYFFKQAKPCAGHPGDINYGLQLHWTLYPNRRTKSPEEQNRAKRRYEYHRNKVEELTKDFRKEENRKEKKKLGVQLELAKEGLAQKRDELLSLGGSIEFWLGLDCAANIPLITAKVAQSEEIDQEAQELLELQRKAAKYYKKYGKESGELSRTVRFQKRKLVGIWHRENRGRINPYNEEAFFRQGPWLRDMLSSCEFRIQTLLESDRLAVVKFAKRLRAVDSYCEGLRRDAIYLDQPLVDEIKRVFRDVIRPSSRALMQWEGFDMGMHTFERYVEMEAGVISSSKVFNAEEITFIRASLAKWRRETEKGEGDLFSIEEVVELRRLYNRFPEKGFITRHALLKNYADMQEFLRIVKEDIDILPSEYQSAAKFLLDFMKAYGLRDIHRKRISVEKKKRKTTPKEGEDKGRPVRITEEDAPFFLVKPVYGKGEKVGRFPIKTVEDFLLLARHLRSEWKPKEEILKEFPDIETWIEELEESGSDLCNQKEWRAVQRKISLWRFLGPKDRISRLVALRFQEILARKSTRRFTHAEIPDLLELMDRLQFSPYDPQKKGPNRKDWVDFMSQPPNRKVCGEEVCNAYDAIKDFAESKRKTVRRSEYEGLVAFDHALRTRFMTLEDLQEKSPLLHGALAVLCDNQNKRNFGPFVTERDSKRIELSRTRFLFGRGLFDPKSEKKLEKYCSGWVHRDSDEAKEHKDLKKRVQSALAKLEKDRFSLGSSISLGGDFFKEEQIKRVLEQWEDPKIGVISQEAVDLLEEIASNPRWMILRSHIRGVSQSGPHKNIEEIVTRGLTDKDRLQLAEQVRQEAKIPSQNIGNHAVILCIIRNQMEGAKNKNKISFGMEDKKALLERIKGLRFGKPKYGQIDIGTRASYASELGNIARVCPVDEELHKAIARKFLYALGDVFYSYRKNRWEDTIRKRAIKAIKDLLEESPSVWRPVFMEALKYGLNPVEEDSFWHKRIKVGSKIVIQTFNFPIKF